MLQKISIFIGLSCVLTACSLKPPYITHVGKANVASASRSKVDLGVAVGINNPSSFNYKIKSFQLEATVNDKAVGNVVLNDGEKVVVQRLKKADYPLNLSFAPNASTGLKDLINVATKGSAKVHVKGVLHLKAFIFSKKVPIDFEQNLTIPFIN